MHQKRADPTITTYGLSLRSAYELGTVLGQCLCSHCAPAPALWGMFSCNGTSPALNRVQEAHQVGTHDWDGLSNPSSLMGAPACIPQ